MNAHEAPRSELTLVVITELQSRIDVVVERVLATEPVLVVPPCPADSMA